VTTWMLVEDEPDLYEMVLAMYSTMGVEGISFATGEEALDWIEDVDNGYYHDELPELVLLDIRLPGQLDGIQIGYRLRQSPVLNNMAIVLMTAYELSPSEQDEAMRLSGADLYIRKPLPPLQTFHTMLLDVLRERQ
jgi:CheY-like chemotaxis protein